MPLQFAQATTLHRDGSYPQTNWLFRFVCRGFGLTTLADRRFIHSLLCFISSALVVFVMGAACGGSDKEPESGSAGVATSPGLETGATPSPGPIPESTETRNTNLGHMAQERGGAFTATRLQSGRILIAGGLVPATNNTSHIFLESAEIFDPLTGIWTPAASMSLNRARHTDTLLDDGRVLITGGWRRLCPGHSRGLRSFHRFMG